MFTAPHSILARVPSVNLGSTDETSQTATLIILARNLTMSASTAVFFQMTHLQW